MTYRLCILWDMDGVLIDSEPLHVKKLQGVAGSYGVPLSEKAFKEPQVFCIPDKDGRMVEASMKLHGAGDKNIYWWLIAQKAELQKTLSMQMWLDQLLAFYVANAHTLHPREGIIDAAKQLHNEEALMAVVTSGIPAQLKANFSALPGVKEMMLFALDADSVKKSKPDPEPYVLATQRVRALQEKGDIAARDAILFVAVEDSDSGVASALAAGVPVVQFLQPGQNPSQKESNSFIAVRTAAEAHKAIHVLFGGEIRRRLACQRVKTFEAGKPGM